MRPLLALLALLSLSQAFATPSGEGNAPAETPATDTPVVVPDPETPTVARDVGVADLPLLVTEPPQERDTPTIPDPVIGGQDSTFNPFAPLVLPQKPSEESPPTQPEAPEVAQPEAPSTASEPTPAPAAPVLPAAPVPEARVGRSSIPPSLAEGMTTPSAALRTTAPGILESTLGVQTGPLSDPLGTEIAIRTPELPPLPAAPAMVGTAPSVARQVAESPGITPLSFAGTMLGRDGNATPSVSNRVSRSLGNLRVNFTAMSTGTGIFRVGEGGQPVLLVVGERIPGTRLTLSQLSARSAQFTEDDVRHTLLLNP